MLEARGDTVDAYQATKQADVLMLMHLLPTSELADLVNRLGYAFDVAQERRTAEYYLNLITHELSLSRAGALARLDSERSWRFFQDAMKTDLCREDSNGAEGGLHLGAMAGSIDVLQRHYCGLRLREDAIELDPSPPPALGRVRFPFTWRGGRYEWRWDGDLRLSSDRANREAATVIHQNSRQRLNPGATIGL